MSSEIDVESLAVSTIIGVISKTGFLVPHIPTKDRGPSFDGCICVYSHRSGNHEKSDLRGRVDVQVKGCTLKAPEVYKASFAMEISDLRNFLKAGGAMLLVVSFDSEGNNEKAYYSRLLPYDIKRLLKDCEEDQKEKSVLLEKLPSDRNEVSDLFINFIDDQEIQRAYINSTFEIDGDKVKKEDFGELSFGFTSVQDKYDLPFQYLFTHGIYLYADIGFGVKMPVDYIEKISAATSEQHGNIKVGNEVFYTSHKRVVMQNCVEIHLGQSHRIILYPQEKEVQYKYKLCGSLRERLLDECFFLKLAQEGNIEINGTKVPLKITNNENGEKLDLNAIQQHIDWLEMIKKALQIVHSQEDLNVENLTEKDERNIRLLVEGIVEKKQVDLDIEDSTFGTISFGNLKLLICALHRVDNGKFEIYGIYDAPVIRKGLRENDSEYDSTYFLMLRKNELVSASNIDILEIIKEIKKVPMSREHHADVILFMLELIKAYDEKPDDIYFNAAKDLCIWLKKKDEQKGNAIHVLNQLQLEKRKRTLSKKEQSDLRKILRENDNLSIKVGAHILLDEYDNAKETYNRLSEEDKYVFKEYPICKFYPDIVS